MTPVPRLAALSLELARDVRQPSALGLTALLLATLALLACGGDGNGGGLVEPPPSEPPPSEPPPAPDVEGYATYAVTLDNRLLLFGTENPGTISRTVNITGLPILNRIVGIDFRPSTGRLYGVGNDSRVYTINPGTGVATAVSPSRFEPHIASFFDIHFGMGLDPVTERIRLIAAESGMNWSIDPDDGIAVRGKDVRYAAGEANEGKQPKILGLAYAPPNAGTANARSLHPAEARLAFQGPCEALDNPMMAVDAEELLLILTCDPEEAEFIALESLEGIGALFGCGEIKFDPKGNLLASLLWREQGEGPARLSFFFIDLATGSIKRVADIPIDSPIQAIAFDPNVPFRSASRSDFAVRPLSVGPTAQGDVPASATTRLQSCTGTSR